MWYWLAPLVVVLVALVLGGFWAVGRAFGPAAEAARARDRFGPRRDALRAEFFAAAAASGKPRGLRWVGLDWGDAVEFARERASGMIVAFAAVTIRFEAVAGGDMEGLPAVGNLRTASAVFTYHGGRWHAPGRAVFNLNPDEAVAHFAGQYERLV